MKVVFNRFWTKLPLAVLVSIFFLASLKSYIKIQTTLIGYQIGQKKQQEADLLEQQSSLTMELAKITTKQSLMDAAAVHDSSTAAQAWVSH